MPSKFLMITWTCLDLLGLSFSSPTSMKRFDLELRPPASWTSIVKSNLSNCSRSILVLVKRIPDSSSRLNKGVPVKSLNLNGSALGGRSGSDAVSWVTRLKWKINKISDVFYNLDVNISKLSQCFLFFSSLGLNCDKIVIGHQSKKKFWPQKFKNIY